MQSPTTSPQSDPSDKTENGQTQIKVAPATHSTLRSLRDEKGLGTFDATIGHLLDVRSSATAWSAMGAPPILAARLADLDRGVSTLLVVVRENLLLAERLETGAIAREIELGNQLAAELERFAKTTKPV